MVGVDVFGRERETSTFLTDVDRFGRGPAVTVRDLVGQGGEIEIGNAFSTVRSPSAE